MSDRKAIEAAVAVAEALTGVRGGKSRVRVIADVKKQRSRRWTDEETQYLKDNLGKQSEEAIARHLGRTVSAVHICRERTLHLVAPSKDPRILTGEHIAMGIGLDGKSVHLLIDRGLLPGRRLPVARSMRVVDRGFFLKWLLDPKHWLYFKPERVGAMWSRGKRKYTEIYDYAFWETAQKLLMPKFKAWKDHWLTPVQVLKALGMRPGQTHNINTAIKRGTLKGTRWGNWWVLESDLPKKGMFNVKGRLVMSIPKYRPKRPRHLIPLKWALPKKGTCQICGCIQSRACFVDGEPCGWIDKRKTLCTACAWMGDKAAAKLHQLLKRAGRTLALRTVRRWPEITRALVGEWVRCKLANAKDHKTKLRPEPARLVQATPKAKRSWL